jgi:hypothetical protein
MSILVETGWFIAWSLCATAWFDMGFGKALVNISICRRNPQLWKSGVGADIIIGLLAGFSATTVLIWRLSIWFWAMAAFSNDVATSLFMALVGLCAIFYPFDWAARKRNGL